MRLAAIPATLSLPVALALAPLAARATPPGDALAVDPSHFVLLMENDYARVLRFHLEPHGSSPMHAQPARVEVALTDALLRVTGSGGRPGELRCPAGQASFSPRGALALENDGDRAIEMIVIELKKPPHARARLEPETAFDSSIQSVVIENDLVRVLRNHYLPGARLRMHEHPARFVVPLTELDVREILAGGRSREVRRRRGEPGFAGPLTHAVVNLSERSLDVLEIELKRSPTPAPPPARYVDASGTELAVLERGRGRPVVLVHGTACDYEIWNEVAGRLSRAFRVVAYSRRFHFPNGWDGSVEDYGASLHARDLAALIERLGLGRVAIVGQDDGARVALELYRSRPELVGSLVLAEPPPSVLVPAERPPGGTSAEAEDLERRVRDAMADDDREMAVRAYAESVLGEGGFDRLPLGARRDMVRNADTVLPALAEGDPAAWTCDDAARIAVPVLLIRGDRSAAMFGRVADELDRCLGGGRTATVRGASHAMIYEKPSAFARVVRDFLRRDPHGAIDERPGTTTKR